MDIQLLIELHAITLLWFQVIVGEYKDILTITDRLQYAAYHQPIIDEVQVIDLKRKHDGPHSFEVIFKFHDALGISRDFHGAQTADIVWKLTTTPYRTSTIDEVTRNLIGQDEDLFDWISRFKVELYELVTGEMNSFNKMMDFYFPD